MTKIHYVRSQWEGMSPSDLGQFQRYLFNHYRQNGFPYIKLSMTEKIDIFRQLQSVDYKELLINEKQFKQTMHGLSLAGSYFPHMHSVRCNKMKTPVEAFEDDATFMKCIKKQLQYEDCITDNKIRKILRLRTGVQSVSNFRPSTAGCIYELFSGDGVVWDMSSGFGGRMLGAMTSQRLKKYIGVDPSTKTFEGLTQMKEDLQPLHDKEIELHNVGSEVYEPDRESLDLCFTSPPYFDCEKYSDEETQSYKKFPNEDDWIRGFMGKTLESCHYGLKPEGLLMLNIANVATHPDLCRDVLEEAHNKGFELIDTFQYLLSVFQKEGFKEEPVYIFKKRDNKRKDMVDKCVSVLNLGRAYEDVDDLFE